MKNGKVICQECGKTMVQGRAPTNRIHISKSTCGECKRALARLKFKKLENLDE